MYTEKHTCVPTCFSWSEEGTPPHGAVHTQPVYMQTEKFSALSVVRDKKENFSIVRGTERA